LSEGHFESRGASWSPSLSAQDVGPKTLDTDSTSYMFEIDDDDTQIPYGSYHQHYLINDKVLIAVGVIDVLPRCISSVYAFYDPVVSSDINLGKVTALYEIDWVKHAQRFRPQLKHYYLGYYIHSCQKMRYKAEYKPSDILCPVNGVWLDFEVAKKRLESRSPIRHCCDLATSDEGEKHDSTRNQAGDILDDNGANYIGLSLAPNSRPVTVNMLTREGQEMLIPILKEFIAETGFDVASRFVIKLY
jgi:arginine-tRNA-protein transferase